MKKTVGGALFRDGKLLVVKRVSSEIIWPGMWEVPGGKLDSGETDEQALKREFFEETKIKISVVKHYNTFEYEHRGEKTKENDYIVKAEKFDVTIDPKEHTEFRWVTEKEAEHLIMSPEMEKSVKKAFKTGT